MEHDFVKARGVGITTAQMLKAPKGAYFVWADDILAYPTALAKKLGRHDLKIRGRRFITEGIQWRGINPATIVIDHSFIAGLHKAERNAYIRFLTHTAPKAEG